MTTRLVSLITASAATLLLLAPAARAQSSDVPASRWEFVLASGRFVSTDGDTRRLADAPQSTATLTRLVTPRFGLTASVSWGRSRELLTPDRTRTNVFTYDVGAEWRATPRYVSKSVFVRPLAGAGLGLRSYDARGVRDDVRHGAAAFVAVGAESGVRRVRLRLELRDYVANTALAQERGRARNDMAVLFGMRLERR